MYIKFRVFWKKDQSHSLSITEIIIPKQVAT